jgi:hypothetical protein
MVTRPTNEELKELCMHCGCARIRHIGMTSRGGCLGRSCTYHVFKGTKGVEHVSIRPAPFAPQSHKLGVVEVNGRLFACSYAEPFPSSNTDVLKDYVKDRHDFHPFDESTGNFVSMGRA